jgi:DNA-binding MarR family transcriptional regulator
MTQPYDEIMEPCGLRSTQYAVLTELERRSSKPPTMRVLADALVLERAALGHLVRPLERDGFIALEPSSLDGRRRQVVLTPKGRRKFAEAKVRWTMAESRFNEVFGSSHRLSETRRGGNLAVAWTRLSYHSDKGQV